MGVKEKAKEFRQYWLEVENLIKKARKGLEEPPSCNSRMPQASFSSRALVLIMRNVFAGKQRSWSCPWPTWQRPQPRRSWWAGLWVGERAKPHHPKDFRMLGTELQTSYLLFFYWLAVPGVLGIVAAKVYHNLSSKLHSLHGGNVEQTIEKRRNSFCDRRRRFCLCLVGAPC